MRDCLCGIWITANGMRVLLHLLLLYNLQYHSLLPIDIPRAHGSARVSRPSFSLPPPPLRKRSGPQTNEVAKAESASWTGNYSLNLEWPNEKVYRIAGKFRGVKNSFNSKNGSFRE